MIGGGAEDYDVGEQILLPYLLNRRITKLDYIICSHFDTDHVGGIKTILKELKVNNLVISKQKEAYANFKEIIEISKQKKVKIITVKRGEKIQFDKSTYLDVIYPTEILPHNDINNNSIVAKFICNGTSILFTRRYRKRSRREYFRLV